VADYIITHHVIERFLERYGHKVKREVKSGVHPAMIIRRILQESRQDSSIVNTRKGFNVMERYPDEAVTWMRHGSLIFVLVGTGDHTRVVTCYEY
jgi:hypothetical protein